GKWCGKPHPLEGEFKAGLDKFYDTKLRSLRRYLPSVGDDKDADAVDSWYLYHPLLNLGPLRSMATSRRARCSSSPSISASRRRITLPINGRSNTRWPISRSLRSQRSTGADR